MWERGPFLIYIFDSYVALRGRCGIFMVEIVNLSGGTLCVLFTHAHCDWLLTTSHRRIWSCDKTAPGTMEETLQLIIPAKQAPIVYEDPLRAGFRKRHSHVSSINAAGLHVMFPGSHD